MNSDRPWEVGADFHWLGLPSGPFSPWSEPHVWFGLGRAALLSAWRASQGNGRDPRSLLIPDYFCPKVTRAWKDAGVNVRFYADDPRWPHPDWDTIASRQGDWVLAVNYFGLREGRAWREWHREHPFVVMIEDHSHDALSNWAVTSSADYAFASLRKTFPTPDGALLWSPRGLPLPPEPQTQQWLGSALKLAAMIWKKEYLEKAHVDPPTKDTFRRFQIDGEEALDESEDPSLSVWSRALLAAGFPQDWRRQREENVRLLLDLLPESEYFAPLFSTWSEGQCPFNVVLVFKSHALREAFRSLLISRGIYAPVHWELEMGKADHALDLSHRVLTIPADQRYTEQDISRLASILTQSLKLPDIANL